MLPLTDGHPWVPFTPNASIPSSSRETYVAVESDPALLELILRNLVSNAVRYTERGGKSCCTNRYRRASCTIGWRVS